MVATIFFFRWREPFSDYRRPYGGGFSRQLVILEQASSGGTARIHRLFPLAGSCVTTSALKLCTSRGLTRARGRVKTVRKNLAETVPIAGFSAPVAELER